MTCPLHLSDSLSRPTLGDLIFLAPSGVSFSYGQVRSPAAGFDNFFKKGDLTNEIAILPTQSFVPLLPQSLFSLVSVGGILRSL